MEYPITEVTAWVILALLRSLRFLSPHLTRDERERIIEAIKQGILWLVSEQKDDGGWGYWRVDGGPSRVYPTAIALRALIRSYLDLREELGEDPIVRQNVECSTRDGVKWLLSARGEDGCWGESGVAEMSTAPHTAHAFLTLLEASRLPMLRNELTRETVNEIKECVIQCLRRNFDKEEGGWAIYAETRRSLFDSQRQPSIVSIVTYHASTPWCVLALLEAGIDPIQDEDMLLAVKYVLSLQNEHGAFCWGERPKVWLTHDCVVALSHILDFYTNPDRLIKTMMYLRDTVRTKEDYIKTLEDRIKRFGKTLLRVMIESMLLTVLILGVALLLIVFKLPPGLSPLIEAVITVGIMAVGGDLYRIVRRYLLMRKSSSES